MSGGKQKDWKVIAYPASLWSDDSIPGGTKNSEDINNSKSSKSEYHNSTNHSTDSKSSSSISKNKSSASEDGKKDDKKLRSSSNSKIKETSPAPSESTDSSSSSSKSKTSSSSSISRDQQPVEKKPETVQLHQVKAGETNHVKQEPVSLVMNPRQSAIRRESVKDEIHKLKDSNSTQSSQPSKEKEKESKSEKKSESKKSGGSIDKEPSSEEKKKDELIMNILDKDDPTSWIEFWKMFVEKAQLEKITAIKPKDVEEVMKTIFGARMVNSVTMEKYQTVCDFFGALGSAKAIQKVLDFYKVKITGSPDYVYDSKLAYVLFFYHFLDLLL